MMEIGKESTIDSEKIRITTRAEQLHDLASNEFSMKSIQAKLQMYGSGGNTASDQKKRKAQAEYDAKPWTQHTPFQFAVALVIIANIVCMTIEADDDGLEHAHGLLVMEHIFAVVFVIEFATRIWFEGLREYFRYPANCLDFSLVLMACLDVWVIRTLGLDKEMDLRSASLLRMLRLLKLGRILKLFHMFRELTVILQSLMAGLRTLFWAAVFLFLLLYLYAMIGTINFGGGAECGESELARLLRGTSGAGTTALTGGEPGGGNQSPWCEEFSSVGRAVLTLWLCLTEGCGDGLMKPMILTYPWLILFWLSFIFIGSFGLLNIIIGLFCENVIAEAERAEKAMADLQDEVRKQHMQALKDLFMVMDVDNSRSLTKDEWIKAMEEPEVCDVMEHIGLDEVEDLFDHLDVDKGGVLQFEEFFEGLLLMTRGKETAKARDIVPTFLVCELIRKNVDILTGQVADRDAKIHVRIDALERNQQEMQLQMHRNHQELLKALSASSGSYECTPHPVNGDHLDSENQMPYRMAKVLAWDPATWSASES